MKLIDRLRTWWQLKTGEEETPFDGDAPTWVISLLVHLVILLILGFTNVGRIKPAQTISVSIPLTEEEEVEEELPLEDIFFSDQVSEDIGANSSDITDMAMSLAAVVSDTSDVPSPEEANPVENAKFEINETIQIATGLHAHENLTVKGAVGEGVTGATGAVDRITHEILLSLEERPTLVIWVFDKSASLLRQRQEIHDRFAKIYEELGVVEASGSEAFSKHEDKPLLTTVVGFGKTIEEALPQPTDNLEEIQRAVKGLERDDSGQEFVFTAVRNSAEKYKKYRVPDPSTGRPQRNVMIVVFTDEAGNDYQVNPRDFECLGLEKTVQVCRMYEMPVFVVGVPAPFGRKETMVKWVDPDPEFDQTPSWGRVEQGPESLMMERIRLHFSGEREDTAPIDSGFGPFALTRLCYETGGMYFSVHPNRNVYRAVGRGETAALSAHLKHFFDPNTMRPYRPDYVSSKEYVRRVKRNKARESLLTAARNTWVKPMSKPALEFVKRDEASLATALFEAQKAAAKLGPRVEVLFQTLKEGESDRKKETSPRWQAGYDLAMGRVMAVKVRTEAYNAMLAAAKRGMKFENAKNNTWILKATDDITVGSKLKTTAKKAKEYLERVVKEHPGTPWALLAKRELDQPLGWKWEEKFTDLAPRRAGNGGNNNNAPATDDKRNVIKRKKPTRKPPPL